MINRRRILGVIPARGGSKGIPKKNIKKICGKPLIEYTIIEAKKSKYIDELIVSTDSKEIANVCRSLGINVPFIRPKKFASDSARAIGVVKHAVISMEKIHRIQYDIVVYLEPPNPLRIVEDIDNSIEIYDKKKPDSVVSVQEANQFHPILMKKIENGLLKPIWKEEEEGVPRQLYSPKAYMRNGAVYVLSRNNIINDNFYGIKIIPYIMPVERSVCIDDIIDWNVAESMLKKKEKQL